MKIGNFQRKLMLGGIDQLKQIEHMSQLLRMAEAQGIDTKLTQNFRGKDILIALQNIKLETNRNYFDNQSYEDFCKDPLGSGNTDRLTNGDTTIKDIVYKQKIQKRNIKLMAEKNQLNMLPQASQNSLTSEQEMIRKAQVKKAILTKKGQTRAQQDMDILECDSQGEQSIHGLSQKHLESVNRTL